ncbi:MAG: complex I NDUFA9 subunit family protein [Candidatus Dormibacteraeota bacterium]|nr:complex I NDUFA9 subunit family protein [Candidatus Dormibacteraeota bacterium]
MRVAVTGGTGFVGTHVVRALLAANHEVVVIARGTRRPVTRDKLQFIRADVAEGSHLAEAFSGCQAVINLPAVIVERRKQTFDRVNREGSERVAVAARQAGVRHLIHQSANGADPDPRFPYLATKWAGEQAAIGSGVPFTVLRPSLIFGPGDGFFTLIAKLVRLTPMTPIAGDGSALFQPISIDDLAQCMLQLLEEGPRNHVVTIGGPEHLRYDDIVRIVKRAIGVHRYAVHLPVPMVMPMAFLMQSAMRKPMITVGQLKMLSKNNITRLDSVPAAFGFEALRFVDGADYLQDY